LRFVLFSLLSSRVLLLLLLLLLFAERDLSWDVFLFSCLIFSDSAEEESNEKRLSRLMNFF
jgi:hypothetical protein